MSIGIVSHLTPEAQVELLQDLTRAQNEGYPFEIAVDAGHVTRWRIVDRWRRWSVPAGTKPPELDLDTARAMSAEVVREVLAEPALDGLAVKLATRCETCSHFFVLHDIEEVVEGGECVDPACECPQFVAPGGAA